MKTKFIITLVAQGIVIAALAIYSVYQQTEAKRHETIAVDLARQTQALQEQLHEIRTIAEHAQQEAEMQRMMCEERLQHAVKK